MKELIEILNQTSGIRVFFYCLVFLGTLGIVGETIVYVFRSLFNKNK
jgi:hypothetical protein